MLHIPNHRIIMVGDWETTLSTAEKKSKVLTTYADKLGKIDFYDDDVQNVEHSREIENISGFFA